MKGLNLSKLFPNEKSVTEKIFDMPKLEVGRPCRHPGCLNHITHACEGCGRIAGGMMEGQGKLL